MKRVALEMKIKFYTTYKKASINQEGDMFLFHLASQREKRALQGSQEINIYVVCISRIKKIWHAYLNERITYSRI